MTIGAIAASYMAEATKIMLLKHTFSGGATTTIPAGEVGPVGGEYVGDWAAAAGGYLQAPGTGEAVYGWDLGAGIYEYSYEVKISNYTADPGPIVRGVNGVNYILIQCVVGSRPNIYQRIGGGYTLLVSGTTGPVIADGDTVRVDVTELDVRVFVNGVAGAVYTGSVLSTATMVGMRTNGGAVRFDDVNAYYYQPLLPTPGASPIVWKSTAGSGGRDGTFTMRLPIIPAGSYLVVWANGDNATPPTSDKEPGAVWTNLGSTTHGGYQYGAMTAWGRWTTVDTTYSILSWPTGSDDWGMIGAVSITGVNTSTPLDVAAIRTTGTGTEGAPTTVTNNSLILHIDFAVDPSGGANVTLATDAALTRDPTGQVDNASNHIASGTAHEVKSVAGVTTVRTFTSSRGMMKSIVMALRPF